MPPVIGIVPGSRKSEVHANLPNLSRIAEQISHQFPSARFLIPTMPATDSIVAAEIDVRTACAIDFKQCAFDEFVRQCDLCLCKSGTSTLHVAAWNVPMIVVYHVNPILWHVVGRWLVKTKKIVMVNILAGQRDLVPEFIPFSDPDAVANCAIDLLKNPEKLESQRRELKELSAPLDHRGASMNAAKLAMELMEKG